MGDECGLLMPRPVFTVFEGSSSLKEHGEELREYLPSNLLSCIANRVHCRVRFLCCDQ